MATVFITGGHAGIGFECARRLAAGGLKIILAGRSPAAMQSVANELRGSRDIDVATVELDLSSPHTLICNAGGRFDGEVQYSPEGYELAFATNCLVATSFWSNCCCRWCPRTAASYSRPAARMTQRLWTAS